MKKKRVNKNENEWKGVLQNSTNFKREIPEDHTPISKFVSVKDFQKIQKNSTKNLEDLWKDFAKNKTLNGEEEHCNVGVNKDWENSDYAKNLKKIYGFLEPDYFTISKKAKRIDFEFTPLTFWQLIPSVAINLHCKEIELTWFCFGMYINFKRNG